MTGPTSSLRWFLQLCRQYITGLYHRYRRLHIIGKVRSKFNKVVRLIFHCSYFSFQGFVWFLILFHVALFVLLVIYPGPARLFQLLYNLAQKLRAMPFGWLILGSIMGE
jgi:hypothetical protein